MLRYTLTICALLILALLCSGPLFAAGDAEKGKDLFMKKCKMCHAENGAGTPAMLKKYGDKLKPLGSKEIQSQSDAALKKEMAEAASHKAIAKSLTPADLDNLLAFIRTLK